MIAFHCQGEIFKLSIKGPEIWHPARTQYITPEAVSFYNRNVIAPPSVVSDQSNEKKNSDSPTSSFLQPCCCHGYNISSMYMSTSASRMWFIHLHETSNASLCLSLIRSEDELYSFLWSQWYRDLWNQKDCSEMCRRVGGEHWNRERQRRKNN